jgi:hypothetical protein
VDERTHSTQSEFFAFWPDSEVAVRRDDVRSLGYSGFLVLTASLSEQRLNRPTAVIDSQPSYENGIRLVGRYAAENKGTFPGQI